ncbi:MAG: hypothetical protein GX939_02115 [Clostridiaceae bacterium]|jgi:hypothetical protein|nr:hypothetical protein [Clostridiaceae bacterium]
MKMVISQKIAEYILPSACCEKTPQQAQKYMAWNGRIGFCKKDVSY